MAVAVQLPRAMFLRKQLAEGKRFFFAKEILVEQYLTGHQSPVGWLRFVLYQRSSLQTTVEPISASIQLQMRCVRCACCCG